MVSDFSQPRGPAMRARRSVLWSDTPSRVSPSTRRRPRLRRRARRAPGTFSTARPAGLASRRQGSRTSDRLPRRSRACRRLDRPRRSCRSRAAPGRRRFPPTASHNPGARRAVARAEIIDRGIGLGDRRAAGLRPRAWVIAEKAHRKRAGVVRRGGQQFQVGFVGAHIFLASAPSRLVDSAFDYPDWAKKH